MKVILEEYLQAIAAAAERMSGARLRCGICWKAATEAGSARAYGDERL